MLSNLNSLARGLALVLAVAALAGCATSKEKLLTHGDSTMMDIWQQNAGDGGGGAGQVARRQVLDVRQSRRRPLTDADMQAAPAEQMRYTRTARNEVHRQATRPSSRCTSAFSTRCRVSAWRTTDALETSLA